MAVQGRMRLIVSMDRPYQKLIAWQEAHKLCRWTHELVRTFPYAERNRLIDQMCRSSYSVPTNLAEGSGKKSQKERRHYYEIAHCSLEELHYQLFLCRDLKYVSDQQFIDAEDRIRRTSYLINRLRGVI